MGLLNRRSIPSKEPYVLIAWDGIHLLSGFRGAREEKKRE